MPHQDDTGTSLDAMTANRDGRAVALTAISPLPRIWVPLVKAVLWLKSLAGPDKMLLRLQFIHVAHWSVIDRFPGQRRRTRYAYLMFASNFNGSWLDYIDDFSVSIPAKMTALWGSSFGFPGPMPPRAFTDYVRRNDKPLDHYYSAYPQASTTEIASALRVDGAFGHLAHEHDGFAGLASMTDDALVKVWEDYLTSTQRDL